MKSSMRAPAVAQLFQQKMTYNIHLRKLERIREDRRHQLTFDSSRSQHQKDIRSAKSRSFAHRYNQQHMEITQDNLRFLTKLEKHVHNQAARSADRHSERDLSIEGMRRSGMSSANKLKRQVEVETQKQNTRLYTRMRSVSSTLSKDRLMKDYAKSQQIKNRISRYATHQNRVSLKSEQFVEGSGGLASHYRARDILKNRIDNRALPAAQRAGDEKEAQERVFATEPEKVHPIKSRRKIFI